MRRLLSSSTNSLSISSTLCRVVANADASHAARCCSRRHFWGPFASESSKKKRMLSDAASKVASEQIERNEKLVDATLSILNSVQTFRGSSVEDATDHNHDPLAAASAAAVIGKLTEEEVGKLEGAVTMLFAAEGLALTPAEQFDRVYAVMCLDALHEDDTLMGHLFLILDSILPQKLYDVFLEGGLPLLRQQDPKQVFVVRRLAHLLLGELDLFLVPNAFNICCQDAGEIDVESVLAEFATIIPCVAGTASFSALQASANELVLKARMFAILRELCASFDPEKTGKIDFKEFKETLIRVVGSEEQASEMLVGIVPDAQGKIPYQHVTATLTRPSATPLRI
mmetsp:Transcript_8807/g.9918  ORF Transcript_8807/g.9918 Transcript_8807/m.9918 type:complete len:341 (-) Transcript_8807:57-1079(-)